jgi:hypothetical protein
MNENKSDILPGPKMQLPDEAPEESPTVARLREGIEERNKEILHLRILAAGLYAGPDLYMDDGEIQDNREHPYIDFLRDEPEVIREKIIERAVVRVRKLS